eukprot:m.77860 g.77860  ORF g.77860 m.77860 type:complete len:475 (+) comp14564_c0_seq1:789-2213(+)
MADKDVELSTLLLNRDSGPTETSTDAPIQAADGPTEEKKGTIASSVFNLSNTILGSGVLVMPFVCRAVGVALFLILLFMVALMAGYAVVLLCKATEYAKLKHTDYPSLGEAAFGAYGRNMALGSVILQQLGACIIYIQIIGSVIDPKDTFSITDNHVIKSLAFWQIFVVVLIIFPLCMLRTMNALKFTSLAALVFISAFVLFVLGNGADVASERGVDSVKGFKLGLPLFSVLPSISFAFVCHMNVFPIYDELRNGSVEKMSVVSRYSMLIALLAYFVSGMFGYFTFIDCASNNLIDDFLVAGSSVSDVFDVVRAGFGFALIFSYPVMLFELRHCVDILVFGHRPWTRLRQLLLNICIIGPCLLLAILIGNIGVVFEFVGATSAAMMAFVMPAAFYLKLQPNPVWSSKNWKALVLLIVGLVLIPTCVTIAALKQAGDSSLKLETPDTCGCSTCACEGCPGTCVATRGLNVTACVI